MKFFLRFTTLVFIVLFSAPSSAEVVKIVPEEVSAKIVCSKMSGESFGAILNDKTKARDLFILLFNDKFKYSDSSNFYITVQDKKTYWHVFRHFLIKSESEKFEILQGGGFWADLDKCSGAVLNIGQTR